MWNFEFFYDDAWSRPSELMRNHFWIKKISQKKNMKTEPRVELPTKTFMFICIIDYKLY